MSRCYLIYKLENRLRITFLIHSSDWLVIWMANFHHVLHRKAQYGQFEVLWAFATQFVRNLAALWLLHPLFAEPVLPPWP